MAGRKKSNLRKRILRKLLSHPGALFLFLAGVTDLAALWAFDINSPAGLFAGLALLLGAVGWVLTRFLFRSKQLTEEVLNDLEEEARQAQQQKLDHLDSRLSADESPRTERQLRDLREITRAFRTAGLSASGLNARSAIDILTGVGQLFDRCILSLEKTLTLWHTAQRMHSPQAREPILQQRERIITEVDRSIQLLSKLLAEIHRLGAGAASEEEETELARVRDELQQNLEVAKKVEQRMRQLDGELRSDGMFEPESFG